jgi:sec-independent protein translocase protein TatB
MFDIGWSELMVVGALALIVVGPKDLPKMLRTFGKYTAQARGMARDFQRSMEDAAREADLSDIKDLRDTAKSLGDLRRDMTGSALNPMRSSPYVSPPPRTSASVAAPMPPVAPPTTAPTEASTPAPVAARADATPAPSGPASS